MRRFTKLLSLLVLITMGTVSAWAEDYEASVTVNGTTTNYTTFVEAFEAAKTANPSATITLLKDCESSVPDVESFEDITISGGEHTLTMTDYMRVIGGKLTIQDGTFTTSSNWPSDNYSQMFQVVVGSATMTVNGGTFTTTNCPTPISNEGGTLTINAGTFYSGNDRGLKVSGGTTILNGGTFSGKNGGIYSSNGTFALLAEGKGYYDPDNASTAIDITDANRINQSVTVSDAAAYVAVTGTENSKEVTKANCYATFNEAFIAAREKTATINLLGDCTSTLSDELCVKTGGNVTISGGKHTLTMCKFIETLGSLTIKDGTFVDVSTWNADLQSQLFYVNQGGTLTVNGGTFTCSKCPTPIRTNEYYPGTLTINGGTFYGQDRGVIVGPYVTAALNGGTFSGKAGGVYAANKVGSILGSGKAYYVQDSEEAWSYLLNISDNRINQTCKVDAMPTEIHLTNGSDLTYFAGGVNIGADYSNTTVYLDDDIDLTSVTDFTPIGSDTYNYSGTFDGQGHRIKNLAITGESYTGLFGLVGGDNKTVNIKNVIIDSSCSVTSTATTTENGTAFAGLIGCVTSTSGQTCNVTIENCGNEATVTADRNVGGILGGVFNNDNTVVTINNCYNAGAITGRTLVTALGYVRKNYTINNSYNSGKLTATNTSYTPTLYRTEETVGTTSVEHCYDVTGTQTGVTQITADQVATGELCQTLNSTRGSYSAWTQDLGEENSHPTFGTAAMRYSHTMTNQWGTICLPFAAAMSDDYDFYELSSVTDDQLTLKKITTETLPAGTPAIIRRSGSATDIVIIASGTDFKTTPETGSKAGNLTLTGAFTTTEITDKNGYIIANNAFWDIQNVKGENKVYCAPFSAYLAGSVNNAKMLNISFGDITGIDEVKSSLNSSNSLNGKFIVNGRLVIIKDGKEYNALGKRMK